MNDARTKPNSRTAIIVTCVGLLALTWGVFVQTLHYGFINYDDNNYVYQNPNVIAGFNLDGIRWAFANIQSSNWLPLTTISHMLDCQWFGLNTGGHHLTNVVLHSLVVVVLFLVLRRMTGAIWRSAFVAAIFAIHPLRAESVAWIAERNDVLSGLFFVLTLAAYARYARAPSFLRYLIVAALFSFSLMSKQTVITLPLVLLFLDFWPLRRFAATGSARRIFLEKIPLLLLSAASGVATLLAQQHVISSPEELPVSSRIYNSLISCVIYLRQLCWPVRLAPFYPHPGDEFLLLQVVLAAALVLCVSVIAILVRKRMPYFFTGWFWYLTMLLPILEMVPVGMQPHADRYTYLPHIGLYILATWTFCEVLDSRLIGRAILAIGTAIILAALTARTWLQTSFWRDSETLWRHTLAVTKDNDIAHAGLGDLFFARGQMPQVIAEFRTALFLRPTSGYYQNNLGTALLRNGDVDEAISHLEDAVRIKPDLPAVHLNLANALLQKDKLDLAIGQYEEQLKLQPENFIARCNLATALLQKGERDQAIAQYIKVLETRPDYAEAHFNLANCFAEKGELDFAIAHYEEAAKLAPTDPKIHNNMGVALLKNRELGRAIAQWEEALRLQPDNVDVQNNLAWMLATSGDASIRNGTRALELALRATENSFRSSARILRTFAAAYAENGRFEEASNTAHEGAELARSQRDTNLSGQLDADLALYQTNQPVRMPNE